MSLTKCTEIRQLRNNPTEENLNKLDKLGYKPYHDGFVDVHFSDPTRGLHGATPAEVLHAFQLGIAQRVIETCFDQRKRKKRKHNLVSLLPNAERMTTSHLNPEASATLLHLFIA
jgi:N-formylglutamate amidohydrolase